MARLPSCPSCGGLVPARVLTCPHCDASVVSAPTTLQKIARGLLAATSGSALSVTLMACYGAPVCEPEDDNDGDGYCPEYDCNDNDDTIYPGAEDLTEDGIDQNCDGVDGIPDEDDGGVDDDAGVTDDDAGVTDGG